MKNAFKKHKYLYIGAILVLIVGGYYWYKKSHATTAAVQYKTVAAEKGTLTTSVSASGNIIVDQSATVDPTINGTVSNVAVNVGDPVKKGQILFTIINNDLSVSVAKSTASYAQSQSSLESAEASLKQAKVDYKSSNTNSANQKQVLKEKVEAAEASVVSAKQSLSASLADLNNQKLNAGKRSVMSPINGTVNAINVKNGDNLGASSSTHVAPMIVGDLSTLKAQVQVNEVDVSNVSIGQKVNLTFDAISGFSASGKVEKMDSLGTTTQGVVTYNITIGMDSLDQRIKPDMSVTAAIITSIKQDVITVPVSAVKTQNGRSYAEVLNGSVPSQVPVEVGTSNDASVEIVSGINVGDKVVTQTINSGATSSSSSTSSSTGANRSGGGGGARVPGLGGLGR